MKRILKSHRYPDKHDERWVTLRIHNLPLANLHCPDHHPPVHEKLARKKHIGHEKVELNLCFSVLFESRYWRAWGNQAVPWIRWCAGSCIAIFSTLPVNDFNLWLGTVSIRSLYATSVLS